MRDGDVLMHVAVHVHVEWDRMSCIAIGDNGRCKLM